MSSKSTRHLVLKGKLSKTMQTIFEQGKSAKFVAYRDLPLSERVWFHQQKGDLVEWLVANGFKEL